jgi:hypothetical protein
MKKPRFLAYAAVCLAALSGCHEADIHEERATITDEFDKVLITVGSGDVTLVGRDVSETTVRATIDGDANHLGHTVEAGTLTLFDDCHDDPCSVDIYATVPLGVAVELRTGSGDVLVDGTTAAVLIETGSGDVRGQAINGSDLSATTGSGDVRLSVSDPAERIFLQTGSGDVDLHVPAGSYAFNVTTGLGDETFHGVTEDSDSPGRIDVHTGVGDVAIIGR